MDDYILKALKELHTNKGHIAVIHYKHWTAGAHSEYEESSILFGPKPAEALVKSKILGFIMDGESHYLDLRHRQGR